MANPSDARKLPKAAQFIDASDYARPLAIWIARLLRDTPMRAAHVTLVWTVIGLASAFCYAQGRYELALLGALLVQIKNILDAVDGSLARLQNRPSPIGRFLDSICDAVIAAALWAGLAAAIAHHRPAIYAIVLATTSLVLCLLQCSVYNYYYVRYRTRRGGDTTSRINEQLTEKDKDRYRNRPRAMALLRSLVWIYTWIYQWQDVIVHRIDRWAVDPLVASGRTGEADLLRDDHRLLTAVSVLGPGLTILLLDVFTLAGYRHLGVMVELFLWTVALGGTLYTAAIFVGLRQAAVRLVRTEI